LLPVARVRPAKSTCRPRGASLTPMVNGLDLRSSSLLRLVETHDFVDALLAGQTCP
jgi:hypothetical protein